jgi:hypothetical protein
MLNGVLMPGRQKPQWVQWLAVFKGLEIIISGLQNQRIEKYDNLLLSSELRQLMIRALPFFDEAGMAGLISNPAAHKGTG